MSASHYASAAAKRLADLPDSGPPPSEAARAAAVATLERALQMRRARVKRRRWAVAAGAVVATSAAVAASVMVARTVLWAPPPTRSSSANEPGVTVVARSSEGAAVVLAAGQESALDEGKALTEGAHIVTRGGGRATLDLSTGTRLAIEADADFTILEQGASQRFALGAGAVQAHVAKLGKGERFLVTTPDAEVEVRGTTFRVGLVPASVACGEGSRTRVEVVEGTVTVRSRGALVYVRSGESWPSDCARTAAAADSAAPTSPRRPAAERAKPPSSTSAETASAGARRTGKEGGGAVQTSSLAEQNDLFARATAARHSGRSAEALALYGQLVNGHPDSALAESASVERMKLLRETSAVGAADAARRYLAAYPQGFARADAEAILAERR